MENLAEYILKRLNGIKEDIEEYQEEKNINGVITEYGRYAELETLEQNFSHGNFTQEQMEAINKKQNEVYEAYSKAIREL